MLVYNIDFDHFADFPRELFDRGQVVAAAIRAMRHAEFDGCVHGRMEPPRTNLVFEASASKILVHPIANGCEGDSDATFFEVSVKALEHMNCRRVQRDDCGALYHNIADAPVCFGGILVEGEDQLLELVSDEGHVGEVHRRTNAYNQHAIDKLPDGILLDVAINRRAREAPQDDHLWADRLIDDDKEREADGHQDALLHSEEEGAEEGYHPQSKVGFLHVPQIAGLCDVHEIRD
mmetsp:Transcript_10451/g.32161  ORF Transcript_10451/g.32161 Transcript_10451/m.32161 type:complete len:234 (-) Transcript_10451:1512-2213(-)